MKKIIIVLIVGLLCINCSAQQISERNYSKGIVYVLPEKVQELIKQQEINKPNVYFCLEN